MTRSPRLCRLGWHKWRRRPQLGVSPGLTWWIRCDRCDAYRDRFTKATA